MRLYLDACAIIYSLEGTPAVRGVALRYVAQAEISTGGVVITSRLARMECRVKPLKTGAADALALYDAFFARRRLRLAEVSADVIERATELRAAHGFKTPDAIHLATAQLESADLFLTGDANLKRCPGLQFVVLDPTAEPTP